MSHAPTPLVPDRRPVAARLLALTRYGSVGALCAGLNLGVMYLSTGVAHLHYLVGCALSFALLVPLSFVLQRAWVFRSQDASLLRQFARYFVSLLAGLVVNTTLLIGLIEGARLNYLVATAVVTVANFCFNYALQALWVFARRTEERAA